MATALAPVFTEVVVAPDYEPEALTTLTAKKNLRVLTATEPGRLPFDVRSIDGGLLVQQPDPVGIDRSSWRIVTDGQPRSNRSGPTSSSPGSCAPRCRPTPSCSPRTGRPSGSAPASRTASTRPRIAADQSRRPRRRRRLRQRRLLPVPRRARHRRRRRHRRRDPARRQRPRRRGRSPPPTSTASPWSSPANATSGTELAAGRPPGFADALVGKITKWRGSRTSLPRVGRSRSSSSRRKTTSRS